MLKLRFDSVEHPRGDLIRLQRWRDLRPKLRCSVIRGLRKEGKSRASRLRFLIHSALLDQWFPSTCAQRATASRRAPAACQRSRVRSPFHRVGVEAMILTALRPRDAG